MSPSLFYHPPFHRSYQDSMRGAGYKERFQQCMGEVYGGMSRGMDGGMSRKIDGGMGREMDGKINKGMNKKMGGRIDGRMDGRMRRKMDRRMSGWMDENPEVLNGGWVRVKNVGLSDGLSDGSLRKKMSGLGGGGEEIEENGDEAGDEDGDDDDGGSEDIEEDGDEDDDGGDDDEDNDYGDDDGEDDDDSGEGDDDGGEGDDKEDEDDAMVNWLMGKEENKSVKERYILDEGLIGDGSEDWDSGEGVMKKRSVRRKRKKRNETTARRTTTRTIRTSQKKKGTNKKKKNSNKKKKNSNKKKKNRNKKNKTNKNKNKYKQNKNNKNKNKNNKKIPEEKDESISYDSRPKNQLKKTWLKLPLQLDIPKLGDGNHPETKINQCGTTTILACPARVEWIKLTKALTQTNEKVEIFQDPKYQPQWFYQHSCDFSIEKERRFCPTCCIGTDHENFSSVCHQRYNLVKAKVRLPGRKEFEWSFVRVNSSCGCHVSRRKATA